VDGFLKRVNLKKAILKVSPGLFVLKGGGRVILRGGAFFSSPTFSTGAVKKYFCGEFSSEGESISGQKWL